MGNFVKYITENGRRVKVTQYSSPRLKFWAHVNKDGPEHPTLGKCWVWTGGKTSNYGNCKYIKGGGGYAHRSSWVIHFGAVPEGMMVLHQCDNRLCVNPDHLSVGTHKQNMKEMAERGRGSNQYSKLSVDDVAYVRETCLPSLTEAANRLDVPVYVLCDLLAGRTYKSRLRIADGA